MTEAFIGPPWQMDRRLDALANRDALPEHVRVLVDEARAELVTARDPYFRGIDTDAETWEVRACRPSSASGRSPQWP